MTVVYKRSDERELSGENRGKLATIFAELAHGLHQHLALSRDVAASNAVLLELLDRAQATAGASGFARVTEQLVATNSQLHEHTQQVMSGVDTAVVAFDEFGETLQRFEEEFLRLSSSTEQITKTIKQINQIAFQANILALNARVEAARLGQEGAGFSVVAEEVGSMAGRVREMSEQIQAEIALVREPLEQSLAQLEANRETMARARDAIGSLAETAHGIVSEAKELDDVTGQVEQIAYRQVGLQDHLERVGRHGKWIEQSASVLVEDMGKTSALADRLWESAMPEAARVEVDSLQSFEDVVLRAVVEDRPALVEGALQKAREEGLSARDLLQRVGRAAEQVQLKQLGQELPTETYFRNYFVFQCAVEELEARLEAESESPSILHLQQRPVVVLGNAYEDHHDLGRRMVAMAMRAQGFEVVDLGLSVANERFVETAARVGADVIGVSSLLLHTAKWIPELKRDLVRNGMERVGVIAGGAPFLVDPHLCERFGADGVGRSPADAIRLVRHLAARRKGRRS